MADIIRSIAAHGPRKFYVLNTGVPKAVKDYRHLRDQWPHIGRAGADAATGVYGDPTVATRAKGEAIVEAIVAGILREIDALRRISLPQVF